MQLDVSGKSCNVQGVLRACGMSKGAGIKLNWKGIRLEKLR